MIGSLKGSVESLGIDNCIIETAGGVGYRVFMPAAQLAQLTQGASVHPHGGARGCHCSLRLFEPGIL